MRGRRKAGTSIRREPDMNNIREGLKGPGADTREWITYGTVASVRGEDGEPDFSDPNAIVISPKGVDVDVILEPSGNPVTCTYGTVAGDCFILAPIRPGDAVLVAIPDGEYATVPKILCVLAGPHTTLPIEDSDRKPVFRNDRLHIFAKTVPIEIRTQGGARVRLTQDGRVEVVGQTFLGAADATEQAMLGTRQRNAESTLDTAFQTFLQAMIVYAGIIQPIADPSGTGTTTFTTAVSTLVAAINSYESQAQQFLSNTVKVKE